MSSTSVATKFIRGATTTRRHALGRSCVYRWARQPARPFVSMKAVAEKQVVDHLRNGILENDDNFFREGLPPAAFQLPANTRLTDHLEKSKCIEPFPLVQHDIDIISQNINNVIGSDHPVIKSIACHFFENSGKRIRPAICSLMARALSRQQQGLPSSSITQKQLQLAEITELIHTASLLHDDVIDESATRRGVASVHSVYGNKLAILGGDFLLARASVSLARLRNCDVTEIMASVIEHLVKGEVMQLKPHPGQSLNVQLRNYITKTYYKTASLIANSCKSVAILGGHDAASVEVATEYGRNLGIAFQLVDDVLDFEGKADNLGKPTLNDIKQGMATLPVLLASSDYPQINSMMARKFNQEGDVEQTMEYVVRTDSIAKARELAYSYGASAVASVLQLPESDEQHALIQLVDLTLNRNK